MLLPDIETYLNTFGTFTQSGTDYVVRTYETPDTPDAVISLLSFPAGAAVHAMGPSLSAPVREKIGLMVIVRGPIKDAANAASMAETVHQKLERFNGSLSGRLYSIYAMHGPLLKEQDRNSRWRFESNYVVLKERG